MRRAVLILVLLAAAAVSMAAGAGAAGPVSRHTVPGFGVSLAVPTSWVAVDHREVLTKDVLDRLARENPQLASLFSALRGGGVKFVAADPNVSGDFATNVNVVITTAPRGMTFATYRRVIATQIGALPSVLGRVRNATVSLPSGQAVRLRYNLRLEVGGRRISTETLQYAFLRNGRSIVVTYTTTPSRAAAYGATFAASARSIRL